MKKLTSLGLGMGIVLACTVVPVSAVDSYENRLVAGANLGALGLVDNVLYRITTLPGYTLRPVPRPPKVPSVLDIRNGSLYPVRVGGPDAKPPINYHLDEPSG